MENNVGAGKSAKKASSGELNLLFRKSQNQQPQKLLGLSADAFDAAIVDANDMTGFSEAQKLDDVEESFVAERRRELLPLAIGALVWDVDSTTILTILAIPLLHVRTKHVMSGITCHASKLSTKTNLTRMLSLWLNKSKPLFAPTSATTKWLQKKEEIIHNHLDQWWCKWTWQSKITRVNTPWLAVGSWELCIEMERKRKQRLENSQTAKLIAKLINYHSVNMEI